RLVRGWTHLERQKGGIGLRGPGETQLETDRRIIAQRVRVLTRRLARIQQQRETGRQTRAEIPVPSLALVGYTNAGKSTLFRALTGADAYVADQLFATLDPTVRRLTLPGGTAVVAADTVGFIRELPHELVAAFQSTLTEARAVAERLARLARRARLRMPAGAGALRSRLYAAQAVRAETSAEDGSIELAVELPDLELLELARTAGVQILEVQGADMPCAPGMG